MNFYSIRIRCLSYFTSLVWLIKLLINIMKLTLFSQKWNRGISIIRNLTKHRSIDHRCGSRQLILIIFCKTFFFFFLSRLLSNKIYFISANWLLYTKSMCLKFNINYNYVLIGETQDSQVKICKIQNLIVVTLSEQYMFLV